jgi:ribonuclease HI
MFSLNSRNQLSKNQFGFTPQKSTEDLLLEVKQEITQTFEEKDYCLIISFDIDGAFNNLLWHKTINQLKDKNCERNLVKLSISYFNTRKAEIWTNNAKYTKVLTKGCPQGSACGPGFWVINYDSLLKIPLEDRCKLKGFADDTLAIIRAKSISDLELKANNTINAITAWGRSQELKFNIQKTTAVLFTNKLNYIKPNIIMDGQTLDLQNSFKYLGIIIDNKLRFTKHISYVKGKAASLTMNLLRFVRNNFGLKKNNFLSIIYKAVIQPLIAYGCVIWFEKVDQIFFNTILNQTQRLIAIRCCSGYRTIASDAAGVLANFIPLDLYIKQRAVEYHIKKGITNFKVEEILNETGLIKENYQKPVKYGDKPHPAIRSQVLIRDHDSQIQVFTDGSKSNSGVGSAFCVYSNSLVIKKCKFKLTKYCTVFQSECYALKEAIKYFNTTDYSTATFQTDSQSVLSAINQRSSNTKLVHQINEELTISRSKNKKCHFNWIRSHTGNEGNELADLLAKHASKSHQSFSYDLYPFSYAKRQLNEYTLNKWNDRWVNSSTGRGTRKFFPTIFDRQSCKRYFSTNFYMTQLITNHGNFNQYLERFKLRTDWSCECDGVIPQTAEDLRL